MADLNMLIHPDGDILRIGHGFIRIDRGGDRELIPYSAIMGAYPVVNATPGAAAIDDGGDGIPVKSLTVNIEPDQLRTGDPSATNIRTISPRTGLTIYRGTGNLFGGDALKEGILNGVQNATADEETKTVRFVAGAPALNPLSKGMRFANNTPYTFVLTLENTASTPKSNLRIFYTDGTHIDVPSPTAPDTKETFIVTTAAAKTVDRLAKRNSGGTTAVYYDESGIFEGAITAEQFTPYDVDTLPITWEAAAGEVYAGRLDVTTGELTVTHLYVEITGNVRVNNTMFCHYPVGPFGFVDQSVMGWCNRLPFRTNYQSVASVRPLNSSGFNFATISIRIDDGEAENMQARVEQTNAALAQWAEEGNPLQVVYGLTEPVKYKLSPQVVETLLGKQSIWSDAGPIDLSYRVDPTIAYNKIRGVKYV